HHTISAQHTVEAPGKIIDTVGDHCWIQVEVGDLAAGMYSGIRTAGTDHSRRLTQPQHPCYPGFQLTLTSPPPGVRRPSGEVRSVVGDVEPPPHRRRFARFSGHDGRPDRRSDVLRLARAVQTE